MKRMNALPVLFLLINTLLYNSCTPTVSLTNSATLSPVVANMFAHTLTCFYYTTCPTNPLMGAPCYQYNSADTVVFGSGKVFFQFTPGNKIIRSTIGIFHSSPHSYVYSLTGDSLAFDIAGETLLLVHRNTQIRDSIKISVVNDSMLVLNYVTAQGITVENDSLRR